MYKILVVDDDEMCVEMLVEFLKMWGHSVSTAESGEQALAAVREEHFQLIILDYNLSGMNGEAVYCEILNRHGPIPCIVATGDIWIAKRIRESKLGVNVLEKPFQLLDLKDEIELALRRGGGEMA